MTPGTRVPSLGREHPTAVLLQETRNHVLAGKEKPTVRNVSKSFAIVWCLYLGGKMVGYVSILQRRN